MNPTCPKNAVRIVVLSETFSKKTGYINNMLPRFLARAGMEVHLVTMNLPPYYQLADHRQTYGSFADGSELRVGAEESYDGYRLHVLGHERRLGYMRPVGLKPLLERLEPDVVQAPSAVGWLPLESALARGSGRGRYQLFTGSHTTKSTFPLAQHEKPWFSKSRIRCTLMRGAPGRFVSRATVKCYCPTDDCAEIAWRFFGVEREKVEVMPLGVDTDTFFPVATAADQSARQGLRSRLGIRDDEIVCVYSGKFTKEKNPVIVAEAVAALRAAGHRFRGLFIGAGVQRDAIGGTDGAIVVDFMPHADLAQYYRASDIGVWPTNESTSTLDAAACGLPLIVSDGIAFRAHVTGNGLTYKMNDLADLTRVMRELETRESRRALGDAGARKMATQWSWKSVADRRLADYRHAVERAE